MLRFEEDPRLNDLLPEQQCERLCRLLGELGGGAVALSEQARAGGVAVELNLDTLGWLYGELPPQRLQAAAELFEALLRQVAKYRLAANLHDATTEASYAELQNRNRALEASKARYKALAAQLQGRVDAQVELVAQTQRQLYESARLRAVGQLAAGVAHEINNPLGFINSNLRVACDYLDEVADLLDPGHAASPLLNDFRALLQESMAGGQRIARIVGDLKTFANIDQADFVPCDLNALLTSACHLLGAEKPSAPTIRLDLGELPRLHGYPAKLAEAFYNLLDNASKALGDDGLIQVSSRDTGAVLEVDIEDNGCGIAEAIKPRIFDPFFTTREVGAGSGLGLSVARDIVNAHQGELFLDSQIGRGTRVTLRFPRN